MSISEQKIVDELWKKEVPKLIREFQAFRRAYTMTENCKAIRLDEVAQFVLYKEGALGIKEIEKV